jgi:2-polyprenyl-3-methyl-5-hydroxy-6-metoxy-1,4-benzoquinol methylase
MQYREALNAKSFIFMMIFTTQAMQDILPTLENILLTQNNVTFTVLNPDTSDAYAGTHIEAAAETYIYRSYKAWSDLAELLHCKMLTPEKTETHLVKLTYTKLKTDSFHTDNKDSEKYGTTSHFAQIHKMEEPAFFYYYKQALNNVKVENRTDILNLGVNRADEFEVIKNSLDIDTYKSLNLIGIDHSKTAIAYAKQLFPEENATFYTADINDIDSLKLGQFDLLISIGTLQSPSINFKPFFMKLVQEYLKKDSAIILGFPNSRWIGGEMVYGAKAPNYAMSEMSLVFNDIIFCKKYLQQKKYRVTITGKHYLFLTATKIG